jgi:hypothetical protein
LNSSSFKVKELLKLLPKPLLPSRVFYFYTIPSQKGGYFFTTTHSNPSRDIPGSGDAIGDIILHGLPDRRPGEQGDDKETAQHGENLSLFGPEFGLANFRRVGEAES